MKIMCFCSGAMFFVALVLNFGVMTTMLRAPAARWTGPAVFLGCLFFLVSVVLAVARRRRND